MGRNKKEKILPNCHFNIKQSMEYNHDLVYILINKNNVVYVGCTKNILARIDAHKKDKVFDSYSIIDSFTNRHEALMFERFITRLFDTFSSSALYNYYGTSKNNRNTFVINKIELLEEKIISDIENNK